MKDLSIMLDPSNTDRLPEFRSAYLPHVQSVKFRSFIGWVELVWV